MANRMRLYDTSKLVKNASACSGSWDQYAASLSFTGFVMSFGFSINQMAGMASRTRRDLILHRMPKRSSQDMGCRNP